jgi:DNA-directed RNA polymerase subunit F
MSNELFDVNPEDIREVGEDVVGEEMTKQLAHKIVMLWMYPDHEYLLKSILTQLDSTITNEEITQAIHAAIVRIKDLSR